jgi:hypothetical protein
MGGIGTTMRQRKANGFVAALVALLVLSAVATSAGLWRRRPPGTASTRFTARSKTPVRARPFPIRARIRTASGSIRHTRTSLSWG